MIISISINLLIGFVYVLKSPPDDALYENRDSVWSFISYIFNVGHVEGTQEASVESHWIPSESNVFDKPPKTTRLWKYLR